MTFPLLKQIRMKATRILFTLLAMLSVICGVAQQRNTRLTIKVNTVEGDILTGQSVSLTQTDFAVGYGSLTLNAQGECSLNIFSGNHLLQIDRNGFDKVEHAFTVADGETEKTVTIDLVEKTRDPFAVTAEVSRDPFTGQRDIALSWNREKPAFFDDFESYEPFAISFGEWTGIDADGEATAPLSGIYPNRGVMQYAQIINPLTVTPTWWYDYPILRPYSGQQYIGFIRTNSGNANDDWLITPAITVGTENILSFKAKAADRYGERFMVYVTTKLDNPEASDFTRIDTGNYESVDYKGWHTMTYDLARYAGQTVKFAIRYISNTNLYGAFMLMIDDIYVGQPVDDTEAVMAAAKRARRAAKSPANRFEKFEIYLDGEKKATVDDYSCLLTDVPAGQHTIGVKAVYLQAASSTTEINVDVPSEGYADLTVNVTAASKLSPEGLAIDLLSLESAKTLTLTVSDGKVRVPYLPHGKYELGVAEGAYEAVRREIEVNTDAVIDLALADRVITPYNITATRGDDGSVTVNWNQELVFSDSFEEYDDFATGSFGDWLTVDVDKQPVYPIALGSQTNIVSFPGSGNATNPVAIAPLVFNPYKTVPAMMPSDPAIAAVTGDKSIVFFSSQMARSDKWLITPPISIRDEFRFSFKAKGYSAMYAESLELCISTEASTNPADFTAISQVDQLTSEMWSLYYTDLDEYAGQTVRLAVRYTSYDAFLAQVDDVTVGPQSGQGEYIDYGNVVRYEIYLDGEKMGESETPEFVLTGLSEGDHTVGIKAVYQNGTSEMATYTIAGQAGAMRVVGDGTDAPAELFDLSGRRVDAESAPAGVYILRQGDKATKIIK